MRLIREGVAASPGIVIGQAHVLHWEVPRVPHASVAEPEIEREIERLHDAREWAKGRIRQIQEEAARRLGPVEAQIFEPQILMLDDTELVGGVETYIRENHLSAARAFEWRILELRSQWSHASHPMVMDRLNDLEDVEIRVLNWLLGLPDPDHTTAVDGDGIILVARDLTPSITVQLDRARILGIATDGGTRTSHWAILARSMGIPAVVRLGDLSDHVQSGDELILDGRIGRVVVEPAEEERRKYLEREARIQVWEKELAIFAHVEPVTLDGRRVSLRANIDLPAEAVPARDHGAQGIGLFRTEFLVVGRAAMPDEEEQYEAYRRVAEAFPDGAAYVRTFDVGGDKFPMFLHMPAEENPFLGWRAIRVCLDVPELFRTQLRALLRATAHGDVRIMLPLVNDVEEIERTRELVAQEEETLRRRGIPFNAGYKLGILIETPAAALDAAELARHADFFSIGTNDLVQYTLAVDRTNARLSKLYNPFHPSVVRLLHRISTVARSGGIEVSICGEMASNPLGTFLLLGLDITALSVGWPSIPETKKVIRSICIADAQRAAAQALTAATASDVIRCLEEGIGDAIDLSTYAER
ncbi:MAG: phosphoenolpyruvate--protein phosphotransferase [Gemmatimonadetes bacterium]|nr:phosphoenolpyruvate--protein phosphotransferase [Gemmatimonadota bacterium]